VSIISKHGGFLTGSVAKGSPLVSDVDFVASVEAMDVIKDQVEGLSGMEITIQAPKTSPRMMLRCSKLGILVEVFFRDPSYIQKCEKFLENALLWGRPVRLFKATDKDILGLSREGLTPLHARLLLRQVTDPAIRDQIYAEHALKRPQHEDLLRGAPPKGVNGSDSGKMDGITALRLDCVHRNLHKYEDVGACCGKSARVYGCSVHGKCVLRQPPKATIDAAECKTCTDYQGKSTDHLDSQT